MASTAPIGLGNVTVHGAARSAREKAPQGVCKVNTFVLTASVAQFKLNLPPQGRPPVSKPTIRPALQSPLPFLCTRFSVARSNMTSLTSQR